MQTIKMPIVAAKIKFFRYRMSEDLLKRMKYKFRRFVFRRSSEKRTGIFYRSFCADRLEKSSAKKHLIRFVLSFVFASYNEINEDQTETGRNGGFI